MRIPLIILSLLATILVVTWRDEVEALDGVLLPGTRFETEYVVRESGIDGPTLLVLGGVHGNEPAGSRFAEELCDWHPSKGRWIIIPRVNVPALDAHERRDPGVKTSLGDLNRNFPRRSGDAPRGALAQAIWRLAENVDPDWVVDLHEGYDFHQVEPKSVGSTVISTKHRTALRYADDIIAAVNRTIDREDRKFVKKRSPVVGSFVRAAGEILGAKGYIFETTFKSQPPSLRIRQHRTLMREFLTRIRVLGAGPRALAFTGDSKRRCRVAVYDALGSSESSCLNIENALRNDRCIVRRVDGVDLRSGDLEFFDVVLFPGGSGSKQGRALGAEGRKAIQDFVRRGGAYLGVGAGAFLAASETRNSLELVAGEISVDDADKGKDLTWTKLASKVFGSLENSSVEVDRKQKRRGFRSLDGKGSKFEVLATWPRGSAAWITATYGSGRVVCSTVHPSTPADSSRLQRLARFLISHSQPQGAPHAVSPPSSR
ncbi:MAG: succinylglutamate desuccinylase/aspartoacylase family protein [Planctomycetota bacterium]